MAEAGAGGQRRELAILAVDGWLARRAGGVRKLTELEIKRYSTSFRFNRSRSLGDVDGWRLGVEVGSEIVELDLVCDASFPWQKPTIFVVDRSPINLVPHIESDGSLCLVGGNAEVAFDNPVGMVRNLLASASSLLAGGQADIDLGEFRNEFSSYWPTAGQYKPIQSLLTPAGPSRKIRAWNGVKRIVLGDAGDDEKIFRWIENFAGKLKPQDRKLQDAVLLWLDHALVPAEFPDSAAALMEIAASKTNGGQDLLKESVASPGLGLVVLGADTANGPALAAVMRTEPSSLSRGPGRSKISPLQRGFRPGRFPAHQREAMLLGNLPLIKLDVKRIDHDWIHGRGADMRQTRLKNVKISVLGCGSVGSSVAVKLAEAGVGYLNLVDPEVLTSSNVGRHVLGAGSVGHFKATKLADRLKQDFPHIGGVTAWPMSWQEATLKSPALLNETDLIISTIGSWGEEGELNEVYLSTNRTASVIYGWTEPHALAGHAVLIRAGACFGCGVNSVGVPKLRVTDWPAAHSLFQEPACGAVYQPYGPVELLFTIATIANLALDCLLGQVVGPLARIWCGSRSKVEEAGGKWTPEWSSIAQSSEGDFMTTVPWPARDNCPFCGRRP